MTERDRLISLVCDYFYLPNNLLIKEIEQIVDYLLDNGVRCPPCQVGDTVRVIWRGFDNGDDEASILEDRVWSISIRRDGIRYETGYLSNGVYGVNLFSTRQEAEAKLKEGEGDA